MIRIIALLTTLFFALPSFAASIIRDAETEYVLREITFPIFNVADLGSDSVNIYIINDHSINAFVAGGQNIFVHTGLLRQSNHPSVAMGVLAHEAGHIAGGHLVRTKDEIKRATATMALGYILGIATMAAGGGEAGAAMIAGSQHVAGRNFLKYTRTHEEAADQAALSYLGQLGYSPKGLKDLLTALNRKEKALYGELDPYVLTHPLSQQRIEVIANAIKQHQGSYKELPETLIWRYKMVVAKLDGFLQGPDETFAEYKGNRDEDFYARAVAYHRKGHLDRALQQMDTLLSRHPEDPYFMELKGQILFESGKIKEAITYYDKVRRLLPHNSLIKIQLGTAQIAAGDPHNIRNAITYLQAALLDEKENSFAWRQLAIAYGRNGQIGLSNIALAEEALLKSDKKQAKSFIATAEKHIEAGSNEEVKLLDVKKALEQAEE